MKINIVLVDDSKLNVIVMSQLLDNLETGHDLNVFSFTDSKKAWNYIQHNPVDLLISDYMMPDITGLTLLKRIKDNSRLSHIMVVIVTSFSKKSFMSDCLKLGASDFIRKPVTSFDFIKVKNLITLCVQNKMMKNQVVFLHEEVDKATKTIKKREFEIINRLAVAAEMRDNETGKHIQRVSQYSLLLSKAIDLDKKDQELIEKASPLHDVGKIAVPDTVLKKPDKLSQKEWISMRNHTLYGYKILFDPEIKLLKIAAEIALYHHERWDGNGYPYERKAKEIPLHARIVSIADVFDAWTTKRRYKEAWSLEKAFSQLEKEKETAFDPALCEAFLAHEDHVTAIYNRLKDD